MKVSKPFRMNRVIAALIFTSPLAHGHYDDLFELSLQSLITIPISGSTLFEETKQSVPSAVTVFSRQQIENLGVDSLADLANLAPGFQVLRSGDNSGYSAISSRGRRISAKSAEILLLVDGQRLQDARISGIVSLLEFPLFAVERVEFIRGPGAALYGSGAMMGVINVITREEVSTLEAYSGNYGNAQVHLGTGAQGEYGQFDGLLSYRSSDGQAYTLPDSFTGSPVTTRDPHQKSNAMIKYSRDRWHFQAQFSEQVYENFYAIEVVDPKLSHADEAFWAGSLSHRIQSGDTHHKTTLAVSAFTNKTQARFTPYGALASVSEPSSTEPSIALSHFTAQEIEFSHQTQAELNSSNQVVAGIILTKQEITHDALYKNFLNVGDTDADGINNYLSSPGLDFTINNYWITEESYTGIYGQWQFKSERAGEFTLGARQDYYFDIEEQHFSPRLAWVLPMHDNQSIKFLYGQAFRAPNLHEIGVVPNGFLSSNPDLKPETVSTSEIIWFGSNDFFSWSLGYFYNTFDDPILLEVIDGNLSSGERKYVNSKHSDISGLEGEIQLSIGNLLCSTNATKILKTDDIAYRESTELMSLTVNYHLGQWNYNVSAAYRGERGSSLAQQASLESYWLSAAKIQYRIFDGFDLIAQAKNLTDETVYYPTQGDIAAEGIPSRGSEYSMGIRWQL